MCVNPRFLDCADTGPEGIRAFNLRNALAQPVRAQTPQFFGLGAG